MKIKIILSSIIIFQLCYKTSAQSGVFIKENAVDTEFKKENFPTEDKQQFKAAVAELEAGDANYNLDYPKYKDALVHYLKANQFNQYSSKLNFKIGKCYLRGTIYKLKSISYFEKAYILNPNVDPEIQFMLGEAYQINSEWDKAIESYNKYPKDNPAATADIRERVNKRIKECNTGKELMENPVRAFIDNIGSTVNTKAPEYGAIISADESIMIFTSRREGTTGGKMDPFINEYYEDLYITQKVNGQWSTPINMGKPINSDGHDATINLSPDGQTLLIYQDDKGDGNIYQCNLTGETWSKPKKLDKNINTEYHESSACFTSDGKTLYFVSGRKEGSMGGLDIWVSQWNPEKEKWGPAANLGPTINTKFDEEGVFIHPDGRTLYFSSKGHNTMGGFDIFKSVLENGKWTTPQNIGHPINTPDDDVFFVMAASGKRGYYASYKVDGYGEKDIYSITFLGPEKPLVLNSEDNLLASRAEPVKETIIEPAVEVSKNRVTILKGYFKDAETLSPLEVSIELMDNQSGEMVAQLNSNSKTGKYLVSLPSGKNYGMAAKAEGYLFHSENFNIPEEAAYKEVNKDILMKKIKVGSIIVLNNIFFDYGKYSLRAESTFELGRVFKIMTDNPTIKVEISGHTDSHGSDDFNQKLSENRSKSVVDYLIEKGISKDRLSYKGYGKTQPIATNDTEEGRQQNRRTEFKILEK